ncbi:DUF4105 domain-containing protein, partial [Morganella morganii]
RLDLDQHLVLSYRAFVGDLQLSSWDGLTGAYPSRLFVLPLSQVIEEYTKVELRSLASVPLKLDREEVASLVERAAQRLDAAWSKGPALDASERGQLALAIAAAKVAATRNGLDLCN